MHFLEPLVDAKPDTRVVRMRAAVAGAEKKYGSERPTLTERANIPAQPQHDHIASAWTMSPAASAAKRDAVNDDIILITASGSVGEVTCRRYACLFLFCAHPSVPAS